MRNVAVAFPGVLVALTAIRGSTSLRVLNVLETGPPGGFSGPRPHAGAAPTARTRADRVIAWMRERCMAESPQVWGGAARAPAQRGRADTPPPGVTARTA